MSRLPSFFVDLVLALAPTRLLGLINHPALHDALGRERLNAAGGWINNVFMLPWRQRRARLAPRDEETRAYLREHFCARPFHTVETTHTGLAFVCCPVWLPKPIGALALEPEALWNSATAREIRESIVDGSFRHCDHHTCPLIASRALLSRASAQARELIAQHRSGAPAPLPKHVILSHDKSCNLACPSCRSGLYVANKTQQAKLDDLLESSILPLLRNAEEVVITGSGDAFGSNHFRNVIKRITTGEFPGLKIHLHTNGQLFDERAWRELSLEGHVGGVQISIDAARADTYANVRRPGNFDRLLKNLAFVETLRARGAISHLHFSMVVQTANFREMPEFVILARDHAADLVSFNMIRQRDVFSREEFVQAFIGAPEHPEHREFLAVLEAPELKSRIVGWGNMDAFAPSGTFARETEHADRLPA
ncbi:radical SAM protein [Methylosinus sp. Sm6]|uniref:radical SAM protein n=1 Tax=Methylosinus sp. Sm6 TaxID=2866948 RepID=UPI001C98EE25|nr:radical SAM protein [Methylosinus sp. Sm6]MBY6241311.1 radical SAM protein [Methylosinus sp. Sm6]